MRPIAVVVAALLIACAPGASTSSPSPAMTAPTSSTPPATPSVTPTFAASATPSIPRLQVSDAPIPEIIGAYVLFQLPGETRMRTISYGAELSGTLPAQVAANEAWRQDLYGHRYVVGTTLFDRSGRRLGAFPWPAASLAWSEGGPLVCGVAPHSTTNGSPLRLATVRVGEQGPGQARTVVDAFGSYSDNSVIRVLSCNEGAGRALVAQLGQGLYAARLWLFDLATGAAVRSVTYPTTDAGRWVAASLDGRLIAESVLATSGGSWKATITNAENGAALGTLDDVVVQGFSGSGDLAVTSSRTTTAVIEWKTGRRVWIATGPYGGFLTEPSNAGLAVGIGFMGGSDQRDVYLIDRAGKVALLPAGVRVGLSY